MILSLLAVSSCPVVFLRFDTRAGPPLFACIFRPRSRAHSPNIPVAHLLLRLGGLARKPRRHLQRTNRDFRTENHRENKEPRARDGFGSKRTSFSQKYGAFPAPPIGRGGVLQGNYSGQHDVGYKQESLGWIEW